MKQTKDYWRKRSGTGEIPKDDEVLFYGYKEPLKKSVGGFGYQGVLSYNKTKDKVQCHFCGRMFRILGPHINKEHGVTSTEYKDKIGLGRKTALISEEVRLKMILINRNPQTIAAGKKGLVKARKAYMKKVRNGTYKRPEYKLEMKNKKGTCPDQLLDMIKKTKDSFGRVPTLEEFRKFHHGRFVGSIVDTYGSWSNALKKLGMKTYWGSKHTKEELILAMKDFYKVHKRTPRYSDFNRGFLPSSDSYYYHFGNLNRARITARVPLVIYLGSRKSSEYMPKTDKEWLGISSNAK